MKNNFWMILLIVIAGVVIAPARCRAETQCPWLNASTAAGVLGGEVIATVVAPTPQGDTTCGFTRAQGTYLSSLRIEVNTMHLPTKDFAAYLARCNGTASPLKAIGNEAIQCVLTRKVDAGAEQIIGRVRDRAFVIDLRRNPAGHSASGGLSDEARNLAEQVAGALF
ncbi:hypothetical protein [Granulicella sp. S190]|uniref:hypothetical protein n=1 Tax=Granulicella sp. S190 TaxID=1747226 RepID=UPI00131BEC3C|nr:hypothetical protein [Granulicella sp. S190]